MDNSECIALIKVGDNAVVKVLRISPGEVTTCGRHCPYLKESPDGSIRCGDGRISKRSDFQATALVIDYEVFLDRKSEDNWIVDGDDFTVIDDTGLIHKGVMVCPSMASPKGLSGGIDKLYPGSRGLFRVFYESFPKDGKVASILAKQNYSNNGRVDLLPVDLRMPEIDEGPKKPKAVEAPMPPVAPPEVFVQKAAERKADAEKERLERGCAAWILIIIGAVVCVPPAVFLIKAFKSTGAIFFLTVAIGLLVSFIFMIVLAILTYKGKLKDTPKQSGPDLYDRLKVGILGSLLLGRKHDDDTKDRW